MAKETHKATPAGSAPSPVEMQELMETNGEAMAVAMESGQAVLAGLSSLGSEVVAFGSTRLKENIETAETLGHCKSAEEVFRVQCEYAHKATQQYMEEASKIMQLATRMTERTWLPVEDRTKEALRGLNGE